MACFAGGNFLLGGMVLKQQKYIDFGLALTDGCYETYTSDTIGIGPEGFQWVENTTSTTDTTNPPADQTTFYNDNGFWITNSDYILRPEVMESIYYAYRITKDQKYRDWAWTAFQSISNTCKAGSGFAELTNVDAEGGGSYNGFQDSFLFAEMLKYAYLIHTDVSVPYLKSSVGRSTTNGDRMLNGRSIMVVSMISSSIPRRIRLRSRDLQRLRPLEENVRSSWPAY